MFKIYLHLYKSIGKGPFKNENKVNIEYRRNRKIKNTRLSKRKEM